MNASFKEILSDKIVFWGILSSLFLLGFAVVYVFLFYKSLPPVLPIFNQLPWGEERLGDKQKLFLPLEITLFILISNVFFSKFVYKHIPLFARILCATSLLICLFALLFIIRTVQLVR